MKNQTSCLVAIHRMCNLTFTRYRALKKFFRNDFERAFKASISDWQQSGVDRQGIEKFFSKKINPDQEMELLLKCGAKVFCIDDENFPVNLKDIHNPPVLLFVRGKIELKDFPNLAVVGSRKISSYGRSALETLLEPVVKSGVTLVSGLAFGTDKLAHDLSLKNNQRTLAVLGNGIDFIYPKSHQLTADKIINENLGAIISEYLPGVEARAEHFPQRNRIVSGLAKAVILVEAAQKSGTLITAAWANEQGKDIFGIPGSIFSTQSKGVNQLLADGLATPLVDGEQLLNFLGRKIHENVQFDIDSLSEVERLILGLFSQNSKIHIDEITRQLEFGASVVSSHIMLLEVRGWIQDIGQQNFVKNI